MFLESPRPSRARCVRAWMLTAVCAVLGLARSAVCQDGDAAMRAAVLRVMVVLKLAPYLTLETPRDPGPAPKEKEYRIGMVGTDAVTAVAPVHLQGKKVGDATVKLVTVSLGDAVEGTATGYDLLYIASSVDGDAVKKIVAAHAAAPVVLVCDRPGFAALGGGVQLFVADNGIRFEVNADALKKQGLRANSQVLKLSRKGPLR